MEIKLKTFIQESWKSESSDSVLIFNMTEWGMSKNEKRTVVYFKNENANMIWLNELEDQDFNVLSILTLKIISSEVTLAWIILSFSQVLRSEQGYLKE